MSPPPLEVGQVYKACHSPRKCVRARRAFIEPTQPYDMSTTRQDLGTVAQADQMTERPAAGERYGRNAPAAWQHLLSLEDFEEPARAYLPRPIFGYISGAVENNTSLRGNRTAFDEYHFMPRVLVSTRNRSLKTTLFGRTYDLPFGVPPMGGTSLAAYEGDMVLAKVAADLNMVMIQRGASLTK